jgi:hypothetical protein
LSVDGGRIFRALLFSCVNSFCNRALGAVVSLKGSYGNGVG